MPAMLGRALDLAHNVDEAQLFLMDEGVRAAADPRLAAAIDDGLEAACARWTPRHAASHGRRAGRASARSGTTRPWCAMPCASSR